MKWWNLIKIVRVILVFGVHLKGPCYGSWNFHNQGAPNCGQHETIDNTKNRFSVSGGPKRISPSKSPDRFGSSQYFLTSKKVRAKIYSFHLQNINWECDEDSIVTCIAIIKQRLGNKASTIYSFLWRPRRDSCYAMVRQTCFNNADCVFCVVRAEVL
jgi:hypothetical protein